MKRFNSTTKYFLLTSNHLKKKNIMNTLRNRVQLIGNLGTAPEIKTLQGGKKVAKLVLATNETYKNQKGEKVTETTWHNITAWGNQAELAEKYFEKGMEIAVDGKLQNNNYTDKEGVKRYVIDIIANDFVMLGKKSV
jgi:single-strand DNA-binding protein